MDVWDSRIMDMDAIMICRICLVLMSRLLAFVKQLINFLHVLDCFLQYVQYVQFSYLSETIGSKS